jgi:TRAP-type C4-dicarboxylate transport system permease large subunit
VIAITMGGIWLGWFTPTEGAGVGAVLGLLLGVAKGMRWPQIYDAILAVGKTAVPIMILLFAAQLYSRVLALSGVGVAVQDYFTAGGLGPYGALLLMVAIWFVMGMFIDSISIMLLTVPIFAPVATSLGFHPIHFAMIGILAIEAGILTPPFGLLVYGVKVASPEPDISLGKLFKVTTAYWILLLVNIGILLMFPGLATFLPNLLK